MFDYKGVAKIGNRELIGDLVRRNGKYYIMPHNYVHSMYNIRDLLCVVLDDEYEVYPESLSVTYTGLTDKNGNQIFASFEVDGNMSRGGDIIRCVANAPNQNEQNISKGIVQFNESSWYLEYVEGSAFGFNYLHHIIISSIEIIGKQWSENDENSKKNNNLKNLRNRINQIEGEKDV